MNPFFIWLIKSSAGIALFYLLFRLILRNDNRHSLNRFLLIGIMAFSSLVPFIQLPVHTEKPVARPVVAIREFFESEIIEIQNSDIQVFTETDPVQHARFNLSEINWMLVFYLAIISLLVFNLTLSAIRLTQLIRKAERKGFQHFILSVVNGLVQPFSFLNHIVLSKTDYDHHSDFIIAHECEHIRRAHSVDLIVCEIILLLHWFNPAMWFLRRDLKLIHEFEADEALLKKGIDAQKYQLLVLEKAVGERRFAMANHFFQKPILKRLKMMNRKQKTRWSGAKLLLFLPLALLLLQAFNKPGLKIPPNPIFTPTHRENNTKAIEFKNILENSKVQNVNFKSESAQKIQDKTSHKFDEVDEKPIFPGGEKELNKFISNNTVFPEKAKGIVSGKVYVSFTVTKTGKVSDAKIHRGVHTDLNNEALRVVNTLPDWKPGKVNGKVVDVVMTVPVNFNYTDLEDETFKGDPEGKIFSNLKNMPEFPGGETAMNTFIKNNLNYPKEAEENGIQGIVYVKLIVNKTGKVTNVDLHKGVDPFLDKEAIRIVKAMPDWKPGLFKNKPVDVITNVIFNFNLKSLPKIKNSKVQKLNFKSEPAEKTQGKTSLNINEVNEPPQFPGGEKELIKFIKDNIVFPEKAKDHFVIEKVYISFTVTKTGKVSNAKIHRGFQTDLDNEALRVVNSFPDWQPGKMKGKAVDVEMIIPVYFFNIEDETFKGDPEKHVFSNIKNMPEFPGGEIALRNFITSNLEYPKEAEKNGIQGKIYVKFIVNKTGKVTSVGIAKGVEPFLDKEAIRIVNLMPDWKPGLFNGKPVDVYSIVFINFDIKSQPFVGRVKTFNVSPNEKLLIVNGKEYQKNFATIPFDAIETINEIKFPFENTSTYINNPKAKNGVLEIFLRNTINSEIELRKFIANNIKYPKEGFEKKIQGKVKVWVKTNAIGRITDFYKERPQGDKIQISEIIIIGTPKPNSTEIKSESFDIFSNALINLLKNTPLISNKILQDKILEISANFILE